MIVIATNEQLPLIPIEYVQGKPVELPYVFGTLKTGDYSLQGLEHMVAIERKGKDLWGTLYGRAKLANGDPRPHLDRFREELERMQPFERRWWLVEYPESEFEVYAERRRQAWAAEGSKGKPPPTYHAAKKLIHTIAVDYHIPVYWATSRMDAAEFVGNTLGRMWRQHTDPKEAEKSRKRGLSLPWAKQ